MQIRFISLEKKPSTIIRDIKNGHLQMLFSYYRVFLHSVRFLTCTPINPDTIIIKTLLNYFFRIHNDNLTYLPLH